MYHAVSDPAVFVFNSQLVVSVRNPWIVCSGIMYGPHAGVLDRCSRFVLVIRMTFFLSRSEGLPAHVVACSNRLSQDCSYEVRRQEKKKKAVVVGPAGFHHWTTDSVDAVERLRKSSTVDHEASLTWPPVVAAASRCFFCISLFSSSSFFFLFHFSFLPSFFFCNYFLPIYSSRSPPPRSTSIERPELFVVSSGIDQVKPHAVEGVRSLLRGNQKQSHPSAVSYQSLIACSYGHAPNLLQPSRSPLAPCPCEILGRYPHCTPCPRRVVLKHQGPVPACLDCPEGLNVLYLKCLSCTLIPPMRALLAMLFLRGLAICPCITQEQEKENIHRVLAAQDNTSATIQYDTVPAKHLP